MPQHDTDLLMSERLPETANSLINISANIEGGKKLEMDINT